MRGAGGFMDPFDESAVMYQGLKALGSDYLTDENFIHTISKKRSGHLPSYGQSIKGLARKKSERANNAIWNSL